MNFDREQLEALRRQIEEDYRLDMAAIDRLLRRSTPSASSSTVGRALSSTAAVTATPSYLAPVPETQAPPAPTAVVELPKERQPDELTGTLRTIFSSVR